MNFKKTLQTMGLAGILALAAGCSPTSPIRVETPYAPVSIVELGSNANKNVVLEGKPLGINSRGFSLTDGTNLVGVKRDAEYEVMINENGWMKRTFNDYAAAAAALGGVEKSSDSGNVRVFGKNVENYISNDGTNRLILGRFVEVDGILYPIYR